MPQEILCYYVRVETQNGRLAFSAPIFLVPRGGGLSEPASDTAGAGTIQGKETSGTSRTPGEASAELAADSVSRFARLQQMAADREAEPGRQYRFVGSSERDPADGIKAPLNLPPRLKLDIRLKSE